MKAQLLKKYIYKKAPLYQISIVGKYRIKVQ
jgi:hypothetical protein